MNLQDKVAIVTGAGSGIGQATAKLLAKEGAKIALVDINETTVKETAKLCEEIGAEVIVIISDVSKDDQAKKIVVETVKKFNKIDILINNAGVVRTGKLLTGNIKENYDEQMNVNLRSVVLLTSLAVPYLKDTKGCIVNTSSISSTEVRTGRDFPAYCMSKSGIDSFTKVAALELGEVGIRVNAVNPGPVKTNILPHAGIPVPEEMDKMTVLGEMIESDEIANLIVFLASEKAKSVTGSCYIIDAGMGLK